MPLKKEEKRRWKVFSTRPTDETIAALKHLAVDLNRNVEDILREVIEDILNKYKKKRKYRPYLEI